MCNIAVGRVVKSIAGRDQGYFFVVTALSEDFAMICDGKIRRLEKPKKKRLKHLQTTRTMVSMEDVTTNKALRQLLRPFNEGQEEQTLRA